MAFSSIALSSGCHGVSHKLGSAANQEELTNMTFFGTAAVALVALTAMVQAQDQDLDSSLVSGEDSCFTHHLDFVVKEGSSQMIAVEDDIGRDLAQIGITLNTIFANSSEYDVYETEGNWHLLFGSTWGAPYDPHSYMAS